MTTPMKTSLKWTKDKNGRRVLMTSPRAGFMIYKSGKSGLWGMKIRTDKPGDRWKNEGYYFSNLTAAKKAAESAAIRLGHY